MSYTVASTFEIMFTIKLMTKLINYIYFFKIWLGHIYDAFFKKKYIILDSMIFDIYIIIFFCF